MPTPHAPAVNPEHHLNNPEQIRTNLNKPEQIRTNLNKPEQTRTPPSPPTR